MLNREDMLELTRRMTRTRNCFDRIAGSYMNKNGFCDGSFNTSFLKLSSAETEEKLRIAKKIPFSETNRFLKEYVFPQKNMQSRQVCQLLMGLRDCGLRNDALMDSFCELVSDYYESLSDYGIFMYHGIYDIPIKTADKERQWESEEVYDFLIAAVGPLTGEYEMDTPEWGFLYPSFSNRSCDLKHIAIYDIAVDSNSTMLKMLFG